MIHSSSQPLIFASFSLCVQPDPRARYVMFKQNIGSTTNDLTDADLSMLADETEGFSGSDISVLVRDALYEPVRIAQIATHFKKVPDPAGKEEFLWEPCSSGDKQAKEMSLYDIPTNQLKPLDTTVSHFEHSVRNTKPSVGQEDLGRFEEWVSGEATSGSVVGQLAVEVLTCLLIAVLSFTRHDSSDRREADKWEGAASVLSRTCSTLFRDHTTSRNHFNCHDSACNRVLDREIVIESAHDECWRRSSCGNLTADLELTASFRSAFA